MIRTGDVLESKEPRDMGRTCRVLGVYRAAEYLGLKQDYATIMSRGRVSVFSLERLTDPSRFEIKK